MMLPIPLPMYTSHDNHVTHGSETMVSAVPPSGMLSTLSRSPNIWSYLCRVLGRLMMGGVTLPLAYTREVTKPVKPEYTLPHVIAALLPYHWLQKRSLHRLLLRTATVGATRAVPSFPQRGYGEDIILTVLLVSSHIITRGYS